MRGMFQILHCTRAGVVALLIAGIALTIPMNSHNLVNAQSTNAKSNAHESSLNPLNASWEGPFGGIPPFDRVQVALFKPALEAAMSENLVEIERIANDSAAPTFANTIEALEK